MYGFKRSFFPGDYLSKRDYVRQIIDYYREVELKHFGKKSTKTDPIQTRTVVDA